MSDHKAPFAFRPNHAVERYVEGVRQVAAGVPVRRSAADPQSLEFLVVRSRKRGDLTFPKGGWETHEAADQAAQRETFEEAGVESVAVGGLGTIEVPSHKREVKSCFHGFLLKVTRELDEYPESEERPRYWMSEEQARKQLTRPEMHQLLDRAVALIKEKGNLI